MNDRAIIHIDMDAFYASVEQRDRPSLRGKPVIVGALPYGGKGRGVVSAASYEARKYGIHSAQPISKAYRLCPDGVFLPVRGRRYQEVSERLMALFREYTPLVEPVSLDEAFLDMTGTARLRGSPRKCALEIKARILQQECLTASVGIGPNKLIAKIASDLEKPNGFVVVHTRAICQFLEPLPVNRLWGIGRKTESILHTLGIRTIGQLSRFSESVLESHLGKMGVYLKKAAQGQDENPVLPYRTCKSISHETTFSRDEADPDVLRKTVLRLSEKVGYRMRKKKMRGRTVTLKVRTADFSTMIRHTTLRSATHSERIIFQTAFELFEKVDCRGQPIRLLGVGVTHLENTDRDAQIELFCQPEDERESRLIRAVDGIRRRFGEDVIGKGSTSDIRKPSHPSSSS